MLYTLKPVSLGGSCPPCPIARYGLALVKKRENNCRGSVEMGTAGPVEFTVTGQGWSVHSVVRMFMVKCVICCISYMQ